MIANELKRCLDERSVSLLLEWYRQNKRDLPWRKTKDPYHIWLSEIMLQQTRVEAVKPYYARFLAAAPDVKALSEMPEDELMKLWEGLGYYSRARNLQKAARTVMEDYDGVIPNSYEKLLRLSGIGEYTAGAIASIAFGLRVPAIDGNVLRVLSRLCGSYEDIALPETKKYFRDLLSPCVPLEAGDFTQALIELGATVCAPNVAPRCPVCPLRDVCVAHRKGLEELLPIKSAKKTRRIEQKTVLILCDGSRTALRKRPSKGLLAGLYELPNTEGHLSDDAVRDYVRKIGFEPLRIERIEDAKHIFTHIEWHMIAYTVRITPEFDGKEGSEGTFLVSNDDLHAHYAIPSAFASYTKYL